MTTIEICTDAIRVERTDRGSILRAILYRGWDDDGDHSEEYCVELQFKDKKSASSFLKRHKIPHTEIEDHQPLPW